MKLKKNALIGMLVTANMIGSIVMTNAAIADTEKKSNYVQTKVGVMQPTSGFNDAGYDTGIIGSISYGRYLTDHLILEGTVDASAANTDLDGSNSVIGRYSQKNDIGVTAFLLTVKGETAVDQVNLYGGGGIGAYVVSLYSKIDSDRFGTVKMDDSDTVFGAHLLVGANYNITENWFLGLEGMYRWTGKAKIEKNVVDVPVAYNDNIDGYTVAASFGFRF
jgi:opacity protein-like surface antigen